MDSEIGRNVISAITALSEMVIAYRTRVESERVVVTQSAPQTGIASDPWRWSPKSTLISEDELDQIVSNAEASSEAGEALAQLVPESSLREILKHIDDETARIRESLADPSRSKYQRQRDLDHAEAEICVELKAIKRSNKDVMEKVPKRALAMAWQYHRCS